MRQNKTRCYSKKTYVIKKKIRLNLEANFGLA